MAHTRHDRLAAWAALMDASVPSESDPLDSTSTPLRQRLSVPADNRE
jgi:hypothetical protein